MQHINPKIHKDVYVELSFVVVLKFVQTVGRGPKQKEKKIMTYIQAAEKQATLTEERESQPAGARLWTMKSVVLMIDLLIFSP